MRPRIDSGGGSYGLHRHRRRARSGASASLDREVSEEFGKIDVVFSNAGLNARATVAQMTLAQCLCSSTRMSPETFIFARRYCALVETKIRFDRDYIIRLRHLGVPTRRNYLRRKDGVVFLNEIVGTRIRSHGSASMPLVPGPIDTPLLRAGRTPEEYANAATSSRAGFRSSGFGQPERSQAVWIFLLSDRASFITGQLIQPNGVK